MLRFAILKTIKGKESDVILEYSESQILSRIQLRVRECLVNKESFVKHSFSKQEVDNAISIAFNGLISEFKEKTILLN